jgi:aminocarboxymuconate-semialdehyde decarboxylase
MREAVTESPVSQARRLYYDTLVHDRNALAFPIERFGVTRLCVGTDHRFTIEERDPAGAIEALGLDAGRRDLPLSGNARRFLGAV